MRKRRSKHLKDEDQRKLYNQINDFDILVPIHLKGRAVQGFFLYLLYLNGMKIQITRLDIQFDDLPLPGYATDGSAGMDIYAAIIEPVLISPGETKLIPTSLAIALEPGYECQVRSRSGLASKYGIFALNAPGTIDSDYRGEIRIILSNFSKEPFTISRGDRIAQLVIARYEKISWEMVDTLTETQRGGGGFGSTGL
ncbi:MAG: dut [Ignavibacteria bacterium]|nr:dut [Ignavibacteria bacterium]